MWEVSPTRCGMFHETGASQANLSRVVDCFRGARSIKLERQGHRRSSARPASTEYTSCGAYKARKAAANPVFHPSCLPNHTSTGQGTATLRSRISVAPSLLLACGFGACSSHPRHPKSDTLPILVGAYKNKLPLATALPGERVPSVASLVT